MSLPSLPLLLLLVCVTPTRGAPTSDTPIKCKAGDCTAGTRTSVTCNLDEDISVSKHGFSVVRYASSASRDDTGRPILACDWKESGTKLDCYVKEGFRFNYIVTDRLTLEILNPTEEVAGQYACALVSSGHRTVKECTITVKVPENEKREKDLHGQERKSNQTGTQTTTKEPVSPKAVSGEKSNSFTQTGTDKSQGRYANLTLVNFGLNVVILVLFVVGIVVAGVLIRERLYLIMCSIFYGEKPGDEKQEKPNGSIDGKQQTTQSPDVCVEMEPTTPMLNGYSTPISRSCSDSGNSSDKPNDVSYA